MFFYFVMWFIKIIECMCEIYIKLNMYVCVKYFGFLWKENVILYLFCENIKIKFGFYIYIYSWVIVLVLLQMFCFDLGVKYFVIGFL